MDLRKNKDDDKAVEMSERKEIFPKNLDKKEEENLAGVFKKDDKSISSSFRGFENANSKEYYIQTLKNMMIDNKMVLEYSVEKAYRWMKCFGFSKDKSTDRYKMNILLDNCQKKIDDYFDYLNVIRSMDDLELIKKLIFEKHELPIISVMRMPIIDLGPEFDIKKANFEAKNHFNESIHDEDMVDGVEKIMGSMHKNSSKKIVNYLKELNQK